MDSPSSSSSPQPQAHRAPQQSTNVPYSIRGEIRRAVHVIVRRIHLRHIAARGVPVRFTKSQREVVRHQSRVIECLLYRRAPSLEEYQDPTTLEERVRGAGRAATIHARRREGERTKREGERRFAEAMARTRQSGESLLLSMRAELDRPVDTPRANHQRSRSL